MPLVDLNGLGYFKGKENAMTAGTYSASATYAVGDYVYYTGTLYRCTTAITTAEAWTAAHWTAAKLGDDVSSLKSATNQIVEAVTESEPPTWELGSISAADGNNATATTRIRTTSAIPITPYINISVPEGAFVGLRPYAADNSYLVYGSTKLTGTFNLVTKIKTWLSEHPTATKIRFIAGFLDNSTISDTSDLTITINNPVFIDSEDLKETLDNIIDSTLSVSNKAADAATVGTALYRDKTRTSNTPAGLTFWRPSQDGFNSSNKFTPNNMPTNSYCYALGNAFTGFTPTDKPPTDSFAYWIIKLQSTYNANIKLYLVIAYREQEMYTGQTSSSGESPVMVVVGNYKHTPKIMFFGDSITRGVNSDNSSSGDQSNNVWSEVNIPNLLTSELSVPVDNYAIGSIGWLNPASSAKGTALDYLKRVGNSDWYWDGTGDYVNNKFIGEVRTWSYYNTIILAYGVNDRYVNSVAQQLGSINDIDDTMSYADVMAMTPTSIVEAVYQCYRYIREQAPTINIILSDPLMTKRGEAPLWSYSVTSSEVNWSIEDLCDMYSAFAKRYGLGHISNYDAPINRVDPNESLKDDVHPTTDCYRQLARHFAGKISALVF